MTKPCSREAVAPWPPQQKMLQSPPHLSTNQTVKITKQTASLFTKEREVEALEPFSAGDFFIVSFLFPSVSALQWFIFAQRPLHLNIEETRMKLNPKANPAVHP